MGIWNTKVVFCQNQVYLLPLILRTIFSALFSPVSGYECDLLHGVGFQPSSYNPSIMTVTIYSPVSSLLFSFEATFSQLWNLCKLSFTCSRNFFLPVLKSIAVKTNFLYISDNLQVSIRLRTNIWSENQHSAILA